MKNKNINWAPNITNEWLTPPYLLEKLGKFNLDPCAPIESRRPWSIAKNHFTIEDNGLEKAWEGRVFCNPPYGRSTAKWLKKCQGHGNSLVLLFLRAETKAFFNYVWSKADSIFIIKGRIKFYDVYGKESSGTVTGSVLIAYGKKNDQVLKSLNKKGLEGKYIPLNN